jgi:hypothetical protein
MNTKSLFMQGVFDAAGFVIGAATATFGAKSLGFDIFAEGYGNNTMIAILLSGLGAGLGVAVARKLYRKNEQ